MSDDRALSETDAAAAADEDAYRDLVNRIIRGDREALAVLFAEYRPRLWRTVSFRLHPRLRGRIDPDDVLQDAWLRAVDRIHDFVRGATHSPLIWFRMIVSQTLLDLERRHLGSAKRDAGRERSLHGSFDGDSTSTSLAFHLAGQLPSPSSAAANAEMVGRLDVALQGMDAIDREILALRHFEELTNAEAARVLELSEQAASARYVRAMRRLKQILEMLPELGGLRRAP